MKKFLIPLIIFYFFLVSNCISQATIYPYVLFVDNNTRSAMFTVMNEKAEPIEVEISLRFGYLTYVDSVGQTAPVYDDSTAEKKNSIKPYTSFYPKKFVLQPKQQQSIKLMLKNTNKLSDGTYWTRVITTCKDVARQIDTTNITDTAKIQLSFTFQYIASLLFQKGKLNTTVDISSVETRTDSAKLFVSFSSKRGGNSPFFGTAYVKIYDSKGDILDTRTEVIPIYFECKPSFAFVKSKFKPGNYRAEITLTNEQPDIPEENKVNFKKITKTFNFSYNP